jgi:hypothetical protein
VVTLQDVARADLPLLLLLLLHILLLLLHLQLLPLLLWCLLLVRGRHCQP